MSEKILITGFSGSGKSTLEQAFRERGYQTTDIDYKFARWRNKKTGEVADYNSKNARQHSEIYWALEAEELQKWLDMAEDDLVLAFGFADDLNNYVGLFDKIFLLEYPDTETVLTRLAMRPATGYGKTSHERDAVISSFNEYQDTMKQLGASPIDCSLPLETLVETIEEELVA